MQKLTRVLAGLAGFAAIVALVVKAKRGSDAKRWVEPPADGWPPLRNAPTSTPTPTTFPVTAAAGDAPAAEAPAEKAPSTKKAPAATSPAKKAPAKKAPAKTPAKKATGKKAPAKKTAAKATQEQLPGTAPADSSAPAWVDPVDGACPDGYPVKAKLASGIFHVPGGMNYPRVKPDRCFRDEAAALEAGLRPSKM